MALPEPLKRLARELVRVAGFEVRHLQPPGSPLRPTAELTSVLADVRARGFLPHVIFGVGASDGAWVRRLEPLFPDAAVVLIEPRPDMQDSLVELCRSRERWTAVPCAAGSKPGEATLTDRDTGSTLLPVEPRDARQMRVAVDTLDRIAERLGMPDLVKLDVEGFELEALRGASRMFGQTEIFIVEVALFPFEKRPMLHEVVAYMSEAGYFVYDIAGFIRRPSDGAVGLLDLCFAKRGGLLRHDDAAW